VKYHLNFKDLPHKDYDCIVIGSGMGGLTCAGALAKTNHKVLLLEQHYVPGGMTHTFKRKGFVWDVGVHALGEMDKKRMPGRILDWISDGNIKMNKFGDGEHQVYDQFNFPDESFGLPSDSRVLSDKLKERFPEESEAIDEYFALIHKVAKCGRNYFFLKTKPKWINKLLNPFINREFLKWSQTTTKEVHDRLFKSPKLKGILEGQWGYYGLTPKYSSFYIHAATTKHFWSGAYYPEGTSKTIADSIIDVVINSGGEVLCRAKVARVIVEKKVVKGVELSTGEIIHCNNVVAATSARIAINKFLSPKDRGASYGLDINKLKPTPCHLCLYIGFEGDIDETEATQSNQWMFNTWDHENMIWDAEADNRTQEAACLYVSFPTMKDPVPHGSGPNKHTAEVVTFVPWEQFRKWEDSTIRKRGEEYDEFKKSMEDRIIVQMKRHFPKLMKQMTFCEFSTPLSTSFYCESPKGAIYGLEATPERFKCDDLRPHTPIKGYYLSGSDIASCGVVGALMGGFLTAATIDKSIIKQVTR
jgi:all-trans-retinol 13,14-reductase